MTKLEAVRILRAYNEWRRGGEGEQTDPTQLGIALDTAIFLLSPKRKRNDSTKKAETLTQEGAQLLSSIRSSQVSLRCNRQLTRKERIDLIAILEEIGRRTLTI